MTRPRRPPPSINNDVEQIEAFEPLFDWPLNEECVAYDARAPPLVLLA